MGEELDDRADGKYIMTIKSEDRKGRTAVEMSTVIAVFAFVISVVVAYSTIRDRRWQRLFSILEFLQRPEQHEARRTVYAELANKRDVKSWTSDEELAAAQVCASFDLAAHLIRKRLIDANIFLSFWANPICSLGYILEGYRNRKDDHWKNIEWLMGQASYYQDLGRYDPFL